MRNFVAEFSLVTVVLTGLTTQPSLASAEKTVACTEMVQRTIMFGPADVFFNDEAIRLNRTGKTLWFLCKAPTWELMEFNDETKTYYSEPLARMKGDFNYGVHFVAGVQVQDLPMIRVPGSFAVANVKADKFKFERGPKLLAGSNKARKDYEPVRSGEYLVASTLHPPHEVVRVLEQIYSLPPSGRLPVQLQYLDQSYGRRTYLSTASLKRVNVAGDVFEPPKGYRKVSSFEEMQAPISSSELSDILRPPGNPLK
jgi:hypothetical protein